MYRKTPMAAKEIGTSYFRLMGLLRLDKIPAPTKDSSGHLLWSDQDIENARKAIQELDQRRRPKAATTVVAV